MRYTLLVKQGLARTTIDGLRCSGPRLKQPDVPCNKLQVKWNSRHQIAGSYLCERCGQQIEVIMVAHDK